MQLFVVFSIHSIKTVKDSLLEVVAWVSLYLLVFGLYCDCKVKITVFIALYCSILVAFKMRSLWNPFKTRRRKTDKRWNKLISLILLWKKSRYAALPLPQISKGVRPFSCLGKKKQKGKTFHDSQGLIPFQISSAWQTALRYCSSPYLSFQSVLLSNRNPPICRRMAKWLPPGGFDVIAAL